MSNKGNNPQDHGNPNFIVTFVIQGKSFPVNVNPNPPLSAAVHKALVDSGNQGSPDGWQVRTENGQLLDMTKSFQSQGITSPTKLFLSKGPGRGG